MQISAQRHRSKFPWSKPICLSLLATLWMQSGHALQLDEALDEAAASYPSVQARRGDVRSQEAELKGANWQRFPNLTMIGSTDAYGNPYTMARVEQPLWMWGRLDANVDDAQARLDLSQADLATTRLEVMVKTATAYAEVLRAKARADVASQNAAEHERLFRMIERRVQGEVTATSDATLASARLQQSVAERIQFDNQVSNASVTLSQLLGRRIAAAELSRPPLRPLGFSSLEDALEAASAYAPAIRRAEAQAISAQATLAARRANNLPQLVARVDRQFGAQGIPKQTSYLALQYQPGAGLSGYSGVVSGEAKVDSARASVEVARVELSDRVRNDWNDASALQAQLGPLKALVASTQDIKESYLRQYTVGRKTWLEVLNAQREAAQALYAVADTQSSLLLANTRLHLYTGYKGLQDPDKKD